jgi:NADPH2:quinone reductase
LEDHFVHFQHSAETGRAVVAYIMRAAWYENQGPASEVFVVGQMPTPGAGPGEVRIRIAMSGVNPGDVKKRQDAFGVAMPYPRVIPHSDGAGEIDQIGDGVSSDWLGRRVWCYGAQSYRPFGTAAESTVVPLELAVPLPENVAMEQGACLGIPGITGHRAVHVAGAVEGRVVLVQGGAGAVGLCAVQLAHRAGAFVITTVRSPGDESTVRLAGADEVFLSGDRLVDRVCAVAAGGVDHIVEVAFGANIATDVELLKQGGSIATYATNIAVPQIPFWLLVFKNIQVFFLGSDDFSPDAKAEAARDLNDALQAGWAGFDIAERIPLADIAKAHELVEHPRGRGRVVVTLR